MLSPLDSSKNVRTVSCGKPATMMVERTHPLLAHIFNWVEGKYSPIGKKSPPESVIP